MYVKLTSYTAPSAELFCQGIISLTDLVAYYARVSNPSNQSNTETSEKLIHYLIKHKHWSPLEMVTVCLEINTTRDIARQILRHRSFTFQEFSQRYASSLEIGFSDSEVRMQDEKNRQSSIETTDQATIEWWKWAQNEATDLSQDLYRQAIRRGIAKEVARKVLPEGLTNSRMYMTGSLRSWWHYCELRSGPETQKEHREVAEACIETIKPIFPMIGEING